MLTGIALHDSKTTDTTCIRHTPKVGNIIYATYTPESMVYNYIGQRDNQNLELTPLSRQIKYVPTFQCHLSAANTRDRVKQGKGGGGATEGRE